MAKRGSTTVKEVVERIVTEDSALLRDLANHGDSLHSRHVQADEVDQDPGEAPEAATPEERTRDYQNGVREGSLRVIEYVEANWGEVGRMASAEARKRWRL